MEIISPDDARINGFKFYFTGKPCKHGHIAERYVSNSDCTVCTSLKSKLRREKNPEHKKKKDAEYYAANKEKISAKSKEYNNKNREALSAYKRKWHEANKSRTLESRKIYRLENADKINQWRLNNKEKLRLLNQRWMKANFESARARNKKWKAEHPDRVRMHVIKWNSENPWIGRVTKNNRKLRLKANGGKLSAGVVKNLFLIQKGKCVCCRKPLGDDYQLDHIMPIALGGTNTDDNVQLLTRQCNRQKHAKHPVDFMRSRGFLI